MPSPSSGAERTPEVSSGVRVRGRCTASYWGALSSDSPVFSVVRTLLLARVVVVVAHARAFCVALFGAVQGVFRTHTAYGISSRRCASRVFECSGLELPEHATAHMCHTVSHIKYVQVLLSYALRRRASAATRRRVLPRHLAIPVPRTTTGCSRHSPPRTAALAIDRAPRPPGVATPRLLNAILNVIRIQREHSQHDVVHAFDTPQQ